MEQVLLKVDSKGRLCLPAEIREEIGHVAILKKTPEGYLIVPGKETDFLKEFRRVITAKHERTGKPENWSPEKMKSIWSKPRG
jgi:bifunctional DNA-binding transcriptional regulator/antitoxin component of YhaV-PrlF toxin-antitoxin module